MFPFDQLPVLDDVDGNARVDVAEDVEVQVNDLSDLDDILFAHFRAFRVFDHGYGAVQLIQPEDPVDIHAPPRGDVVQYDSVFDLSDDHAFTSSNFMMRAMRIYFPFATCLK